MIAQAFLTVGKLMQSGCIKVGEYGYIATEFVEDLFGFKALISDISRAPQIVKQNALYQKQIVRQEKVIGSLLAEIERMKQYDAEMGKLP